MEPHKKVIIVGAGPTGLFAAGLLLEKGFAVDIYDQSSGAAKKFLIAGHGGLNLTHSEDHSQFVSRYGKEAKRFDGHIKNFSPTDLRNWLETIGTKTFVGSSGRVFPKEMSAGKVLLNWLDKLKSYDQFQLHLKHRLVEVTASKELVFDFEGERVSDKSDLVIFALGGSSWKKTGSDGLWSSLLNGLGIELKPFLPMNCGFERKWSDYFIKNVDRKAIKHVEISINEHKAKGDLMITPYGVEGGVVYAVSNHIRDEIIRNGQAVVNFDLRPGLDHAKLITRLEKRTKKVSLTNFLRKSLNFDKETFTLLKEVLKEEDFQTSENLASKIKALPIELAGMRPIDEAISTSGGVCFSCLTDDLEVKSIPGLFIGGEMLDFEAPTGGYLLQGCFSTAYTIAKKIIDDK